MVKYDIFMMSLSILLFAFFLIWSIFIILCIIDSKIFQQLFQFNMREIFFNWFPVTVIKITTTFNFNLRLIFESSFKQFFIFLLGNLILNLFSFTLSGFTSNCLDFSLFISHSFNIIFLLLLLLFFLWGFLVQVHWCKLLLKLVQNIIILIQLNLSSHLRVFI